MTGTGTRQHAHDLLEQLQSLVEPRLISPLFDDPTGMRHSGAITLEQVSDLRKAEPVSDVSHIHCHLARDRDTRLPSGRLAQ